MTALPLRKDAPKSGPIAKLTSLPKSDIPIKPEGLFRRSSSSRFHERARAELERLPHFKQIQPDQWHEWFLKKIEQATVVFDFTEELSDLRGKEIKKDALLEMVEYLLSVEGAITEQVYPAMFKMLSINLFRPLPPRVNPTGLQYDPEEDEPILEAAWTHLQLVYEVFLRFLESPDFNPNAAKTYVENKFVYRLLDLFDTEDPRERDYLKTTLHRVYGKFWHLRPTVREAIGNLFCSFVYETGHHNGIGELLEILGSIINGFAHPLKDEHKRFLLKALMPLHKASSISLFHPQLAYCVVQYLEKDKSLTTPVLTSLIRWWPLWNSSKQVLFISELEDILATITSEEFIKASAIIFKKLVECIKSTHFQIAERALYIWNNEAVVNLMLANLSSVMPALFPALYATSRNHWNRTIRMVNANTLSILRDADPKLYTQCWAKYRDTEAKIPKKSGPDKPNSNTPSPLVPHVEKPAAHTHSDENKLRRKSLLPLDLATLEALTTHKSLDDSAVQYGAAHKQPAANDDTESDDTNPSDGTSDSDSDK